VACSDREGFAPFLLRPALLLVPVALALAEPLHVPVIDQIVWPQVQGAVCQRGQRLVGELEPPWRLAVTSRAVLIDGDKQRLGEVCITLALSLSWKASRIGGIYYRLLSVGRQRL